MQLETQRLGLRPLSRSDEFEIAALPFTRPSIRDSALTLVRESASEREWEQRGHGPFAVLNRDGGRFLGRVGLMYRAQFGETELSWILREDAQGHGYATEAAQAVLDWGLQTFALPYITALIHPDNTPSLRVAKRLGLTLLREDALDDEPLMIVYQASPRRHRDRSLRTLTRKHVAAQTASCWSVAVWALSPSSWMSLPLGTLNISDGDRAEPSR